ncbi:MAG: N-acetyltransferase [Bacteroidota bacterium]|nr:N-acetyltransferase [Bacteroidota bacterium]
MANERFPITMNEAVKRFETSAGEEMAYIDYRWYQETLVLLYVFVPEEFRGKGYSQALIEYALNFAKEKNIKITVYCSYIARYMRLHPEYDFLLEKKAS